MEFFTFTYTRASSFIHTFKHQLKTLFHLFQCRPLSCCTGSCPRPWFNLSLIKRALNINLFILFIYFSVRDRTAKAIVWRHYWITICRTFILQSRLCGRSTVYVCYLNSTSWQAGWFRRWSLPMQCQSVTSALNHQRRNHQTITNCCRSPLF